MTYLADNFHRHNRSKHRNLIERLVMTRPTPPVIGGDLRKIAAEMQRDDTDWVRMWIDPDHVVSAECGKITAWRGITWAGELLWMVRHQAKKRGYHSRHVCARDAIEEARQAWDERRRVRKRWSEVKALQRDLLLGRKTFDVRMEDAHASALCAVGVESFLIRIGLGGLQAFSGRTMAMMMMIEPQAGFVIFAAHERANGLVRGSSVGQGDPEDDTPCRQAG
jgi:hypothetical protein